MSMHNIMNIQRLSYYRLSFSHQTKCKPIITVLSFVTIYIYRPFYVSFMYNVFSTWIKINIFKVGIIIRIMRINNIVF